MKKICIIAPEGYPVPATKGGAVETLIQTILDENEKNKKMDIICVARYEKEAYAKSQQYKNTKFEYFKKVPEKYKILNYLINFFFRAIKKITKKEYKYIFHCKKIFSKIKKYDIDFIVVEGGIPLSYEYLLKKYPKDKRILHIHGGEMVGDSELSELYQNFFTLNNFLKERFASTNIVSKDRIHIVYNGIDVQKFSNKISDNEKSELMQKYGINKNDLVVIFCGRLIKEKGVLELINAFQKMKQQENIKLLIVGSSQFGNSTKTEYEENIFNMANNSNGKIIITGFVHNSELYKLYNIADIAVVPSIWEEASPLVLIEEMTSGLPIIATDSGGIPEIAKSDCAYILKRDDNLVKNISEKLDLLVLDKELRTNMGIASNKNGKKYDNSRFFHEFEDSLNKLSNSEGIEKNEI